MVLSSPLRANWLAGIQALAASRPIVAFLSIIESDEVAIHLTFVTLPR
jgi:hypothetical protein